MNLAKPSPLASAFDDAQHRQRWLSATLLPLFALVALAAQPSAARADNVTRIEVRLRTSKLTEKNIDAPVYVGVGGREFRLDRKDVDDLKPGADEIFILGEGSNVVRPDQNDPRKPVLTTDHVAEAPIYIRVITAKMSHPWVLGFVRITVNPGPRQRAYERLAGDTFISLHWASGEVLYLR